MIQVNEFHTSSYETAPIDDVINNWLMRNKDFKIIDIKYSMCSTSNGIRKSALIIYDNDKQNKNKSCFI